MTSNSDFFDASDLFNISEQFDIPDIFCRAGEFSKKFNVSLEDIISIWLDDKISLYVNLRSEYCRIIRYANKKEHRYDTFDIRAGGDFYQNENSPQFAVRTFIPCDQSEINEYPVFSGSSFFKYAYDGYASGFWKIKPTKMTHLVRDNYNLRNANDVWGSIPGEVIVYGRDDNDHLIFNKDDLISHSDLQIDSASYKKLLKLTAPQSNEFVAMEKSYIQNVIVILLINKYCKSNNDKLLFLTASDILNFYREKHCKEIKKISRSSISRWFNEFTNDDGTLSVQMKNGRWSSEKDEIIYLIAKEHCWDENPDMILELLISSLLNEVEKLNFPGEITGPQLKHYLKDIKLLSAQ